MTVTVRPIAFSPDLFEPLLAEAESEGGRFLLRLRDEWLAGTTRFNRPSEMLFGAFLGDALAGVGGITLDPYGPEPGLGRVRHVYVLKRHRSKGIGRRLVGVILDHARRRFTHLRLSTQASEAARLYASFGFVRSDAPHQTHRMIL